MGNMCCTEEMKASVNFEDLYSEREKTITPVKVSKKLCHSRLDTVKEDFNDFSGLSENSSGRVSKQ